MRPDPTGESHPPGDPVDQRDQDGVDLLHRPPRSAQCPLRADRTPPPPGLHRPGIAIVGERMQMPPRGRAPAATPARPRPAGRPGPRSRSPARAASSTVTGPTPHSRSTGSGCRNSSSPSGGTTSRPSGLATPLATLARNLVRAMPTVIGSPTRSSTARAQPHSDVDRRSGDPPHPAHVQKRLVDREPLHQRRGVVEDSVDRLACLGVGGHARPHHDRVRTQPAGLPTAHRGADAVGLGLVAGCQHHTAADDHRPSTQAGIVSLLDRRVERIQVGVENGRLGHIEHMFAYTGGLPQRLRPRRHVRPAGRHPSCSTQPAKSAVGPAQRKIVILAEQLGTVSERGQILEQQRQFAACRR